MGFEDFFEIYPVADWVLNLFKTISPMMIALLTIWLNDKREKRKDINREEIEKRRSINKIKIKYSDDIRDDILHLSSMIWKTGRELLESIQYIKTNEISDKYFMMFNENNKAMLVEARRIKGKAYVYFSSTEVEQFDFESLFNLIASTSNGFIDILEEYNMKAHITSEKDIDILFDEAQQKLIDITNRCEYELTMYCVELDKEVKKWEYANHQ